MVVFEDDAYVTADLLEAARRITEGGARMPAGWQVREAALAAAVESVCSVFEAIVAGVAAGRAPVQPRAAARRVRFQLEPGMAQRDGLLADVRLRHHAGGRAPPAGDGVPNRDAGE
jgi:hypothetical protein